MVVIFINYQPASCKTPVAGLLFGRENLLPRIFPSLHFPLLFYSLHFTRPRVGIQALFILLASAVLAAVRAHGQTVWMSLGRDVEALRLYSDNASVNVIIVLENAICCRVLYFYFFPERCAD